MKVACALCGLVIGLGTARLTSSPYQPIEEERESNSGPDVEKQRPEPALPNKKGDAKTQRQIRTVDFANFIYPGEPQEPNGTGSFTLKDGVYEPPAFDPTGTWPACRSESVSLVAVAYGEVTGDDIEEAMVVLFQDVNGSAIPYFAYVYTFEKGRPKLLWAFATGDRAQGGLRKVYAENSELVIELYGAGASVSGRWVETPNGACCPVAFTRTRYAWKNDNFEQEQESEIFPCGPGGGDLEMGIQKRD